MNSAGASSSNPVGLAFREWRLATIVPILLLVCCSCAFPLDPSLDVSQYAHTAWRVRDGFPKGIVDSVAQTPDGYLWLGTQSGLFRFDGLRLWALYLAILCLFESLWPMLRLYIFLI